MTLPVGLSIIVGIALATLLVTVNDGTAIFHAIVTAGWGVLAVIAIHPFQTVLAGLGWRALMPPQTARIPGGEHFAVLRWIREAVNALLPVAQIGGELVGIRLLAQKGATLGASGAATAVDLTVEMITQLIFTLLGVGLLVVGPYDPMVARWIGGATALAIFVVLAFMLAQRKGLFRLLELLMVRMAEKPRWATLGDFSGLHEGVVALYRQPRQLAKAVGYHLISWLIGGVEVMVALRVVGISVDLEQGLLIESIGQAMRTVGFAIPGSLGVQEGGYMLVCGLVGIGPQSAIELSLLKRIREVAVGIPGLVIWQLMEGRHRNCVADQGAVAP